jgi:hypothetical protein
VLVDYSAEALEAPFRGTLESSSESMVMDHEVHTYADLLRQIHNDLRNQHPEWIQPNGESPMCDSYELRLMELLDTNGIESVNDRPNEAEISHGRVRWQAD